MNNRIREIRDSCGLSRKAFGERIYVSQDVINNIERGRAVPSELLIKAICDVYGINRKWLETGEGEMWQPKMNETFDALSQEYHLDPMESAAVRAFVSLPEEKRSAVLDAIRAIVHEMDMAHLAEIEAENAELEARSPNQSDADGSQMA